MDRRAPSQLGNIQPDYWIAEYTTELLNVLNILGWLVELEEPQANLLERICVGPTIPSEELGAAEVFQVQIKKKKSNKFSKSDHPDLFAEPE